MARRGGIGRRRGQGRRLRRGSGEAFAKLSPRKPTETLADYIPRLASVPLDFQPGTQWAYSPLQASTSSAASSRWCPI